MASYAAPANLAARCVMVGLMLEQLVIFDSERKTRCSLCILQE